MPAYLEAIATALPAHRYSQERILEVMKSWHGGDRRTERLLSGIYRASAIESRHSVLADFQPGDPGGFFYDPATERFLMPSTKERNERYAREATPLAACAAKRVLERAPRRSAGEVTHLITVSCTGFFAPGPDVELVDRLGLRGAVERYHIGFMGCYAAFPALRLARSIVHADSEAVVLIVAVELCTLHLQESKESDSLLAASVFADGAAAALVTASPEAPALRLDAFSSALVRESAGQMSWTIGDSGFEMVLSSRLPDVVEAEVAGAIVPLFDSSEVERADVVKWAVHPGGRAILDRVAIALGLEEEALADSRAVLAQQGNMSSATVLFVLERILNGSATLGEPVGALAFGPGLAVESALLSWAG